MGSMKKIAVGRQTGGFMQTRRGTRPLRVNTLLNRESETPESHKELWVEKPIERSEAPDIFAEALAHTEGEEFGAEPEPKIDPILSRIAKEGEYLKKESTGLNFQKRRRLAEAIRKKVGIAPLPLISDDWMYEE